MAQSYLPTITNMAQLQQVLNTWQQGLKRTLKRVQVPTIPWNFTVTTKQGGNLMNWAQVTGADGYEILISADGTFTDTVVVRLSNNIQTSYFDTVATASGVAPSKRYYKIHATAGTIAAPQSVVGKDSQPISATAIAPNDTVTGSSSTTDTSTDDHDQAGSPIFS